MLTRSDEERCLRGNDLQATTWLAQAADFHDGLLAVACHKALIKPR